MFSHLDTISLEQMNAEAQMMTRLDRKYLLRRRDLVNIVADLPQSTRVLEINGVSDQRYSTQYFDTPELDSYRMTAQKRRRRFKVRQRHYVDSDLAFCEVKTAGPRNTTVKRRVPISVADAQSPHVAATAHDFLAEVLPHVDAHQLQPVLKNSYCRTTVRMGGVGRATIDTNLEWRSAWDGHLDGADLVFIETKSGAQPSEMDRILWSHGHRPTKVSKFGTGLAAMHPQLPSNKWRRIMAQHF